MRGIVVFAATYLVFGYVRTKAFLLEIATETANTRLAVGMLAAHFAAMLVEHLNEPAHVCALEVMR